MFLSRFDGTNLDITRVHGYDGKVIERKDKRTSHVVTNCHESLGSFEELLIRDSAEFGSRDTVRKTENGHPMQDTHDYVMESFNTHADVEGMRQTAPREDYDKFYM